MISPGWSRPRLIDQVERYSYPTTSTPIATNPPPTDTPKKHPPSNLHDAPSNANPTREPLQKHPSEKGSLKASQDPTSTSTYPAVEGPSDFPSTPPPTPAPVNPMKSAEDSANNSLGTKVIGSQTPSSTSQEPESNEATKEVKPARRASLIPKMFSRAKSPSKVVPPDITKGTQPDQEQTGTSLSTARPPLAASADHQVNVSDEKSLGATQSSQRIVEPSVNSDSAEKQPGTSVEAPNSEATIRTSERGRSTERNPPETVEDHDAGAAVETSENKVHGESALRQKPGDTLEMGSSEAAVKAMEGHWRGHTKSSSANYTDHSGVPENYSSQDLAPPTKVRLDIFLESSKAAPSTAARHLPLNQDGVVQENYGPNWKPETASAVRFSETSREAWDDDSQHSTHTLKRKRSGPAGPEPIKTFPKPRRSNSSISQLIGFWEPSKDGSNKLSPMTSDDGAQKQPELSSRPGTDASQLPTGDKSTPKPGKDIETPAGLSLPPEAQPDAPITPDSAARDGSCFPNDAPGTLPDALSGLRPISDVTPPVLPRPTKGKVAVRKMRNAAWRPFLLRIALGKQLAAQTKPGLRLLAKGETLEEDDPLISNAH